MTVAAMGFSLIEGPALCARVGHVVFLCAEKEVIRIDTFRVVATMTNTHPAWDFSMRQDVRDTVRHHHSTPKELDAIAAFDSRLAASDQAFPALAHASCPSVWLMPRHIAGNALERHRSEMRCI